MLDDLQQLLALNREQLRSDHNRVNGTQLTEGSAGAEQMHVGDVNITYSGVTPPQQVTTQNAAVTAARQVQSVQADAAPGFSPSPVAAPSASPLGTVASAALPKLAGIGKLAAIAAAFATAGAGGAWITAKVLMPTGVDTNTKYQLELVEPAVDSASPSSGG